MSYVAFAGFSVQHQEVQQFADCSNQLCGRLNTCTSWLLKFHAWVTQKWHFIKGFNIEVPEFLIQTHLRFVCRLFFAQIGYLELNCNPCADWKQRFLSLCWYLFIFFQSTKGVFDQFPVFLSSATKEQPLVILLDSLDQLSPQDGARKLIWFPRQLPLHVKFIVSTLPDEEYKCFPTLKVCQLNKVSLKLIQTGLNDCSEIDFQPRQCKD